MKNVLLKSSIKINNQLITYYLPVCYLLRIQQYLVNTTYNNGKLLWCDKKTSLTAVNCLLSIYLGYIVLGIVPVLTSCDGGRMNEWMKMFILLSYNCNFYKWEW